jgi:hypothetical protein
LLFLPNFPCKPENHVWAFVFPFGKF